MSQHDIVMEDVNCPLGCQKKDSIVLKGKDILNNLPGEFTVVKCKNCGLMRTNPRPAPESIGFYYPEDYGPYKGTKINYIQSIQHKLWKRKLKNIIQFNTNRLPEIKPGKMLEIGCASGSFLHSMSQQGWDVEGVEFSESAARNAISFGYNVHIGPVEKVDISQKYDLIVGWMVLEHLHDPIRALEKLNQWTKPGGWMVLSVPNAGSQEFKIFKKFWYALQLPTHLYHYTPSSLKKVLEAGGWEVERVLHQRTLSNLFASMGYLLREKAPNSKFANKLINFPERAGRKQYLLYPLAYFLSLFGQTGRMTVWAKKR